MMEEDDRPTESTNLFHQLMTMVNRPSLKDQTPKHLQAQITSPIDHMKLVLDGLAEDLKQGALDVESAATLVEGVKTDIGPCRQGVDESTQAIGKLHEIDTSVKMNLKRRNRDLRVTMDQLKRLSRAYVKSRHRRCFEEPNDTTAPELLMRLLDAIAPATGHHSSDHRHKLLARARKSALEKMDANIFLISLSTLLCRSPMGSCGCSPYNATNESVSAALSGSIPGSEGDVSAPSAECMDHSERPASKPGNAHCKSLVMSTSDTGCAP